MNNVKVRTALFQHNMKQYELADLMGVTEAYVSKLFRKELPDEKQKEIIMIIEEAFKDGNHNS